MTARYIVGDSLTVLRSMSSASVDLILTSPPILALRAYMPPDHADKALEMGSEATPAAFIDALLDVVEECRRVLAPHGSICFELGDTYSGSGGAGGDYTAGGLRDGQERFDGSASRAYGTGAAPRPPRDNKRRDRPQDVAAGILAPLKRPGPEGRDSILGWPMDKSLTMIPESFRWALAYGTNPFNGRTTPRWRVRNVVRWARPNPPVGRLGDKFRPATSDMVIACTARDRYFDLDAVRTEFSDSPGNKYIHRSTPNDDKRWAATPGRVEANAKARSYDPLASGGSPPLDHWWHDDTFDQDAWNIPTQPFSGAHFATWPEKLLITPIKSMCPLRVCRQCGQPSRRIVESQRFRISDGTVDPPRVAPTRDDAEDGTTAIGIRHAVETINTTIGWTDCGHGDDWRTGVVLDPFAGSGTTLAVATGHGRDAIGIDIDDRNADLALDRVGPLYMTVEHHQAEVVPVAVTPSR